MYVLNWSDMFMGLFCCSFNAILLPLYLQHLHNNVADILRMKQKNALSYLHLNIS